MSLTKGDLAEIQKVVVGSINHAIDELINPRFDGLERRMDGLEGRMDKIEGRMDLQEAAQRETNRRLSSIEGKLEDMDSRLVALQNDVVELYKLTNKLGPTITDKKFAKLSPEKKLLTLHAETVILAKRLHVSLPQN